MNRFNLYINRAIILCGICLSTNGQVFADNAADDPQEGNGDGFVYEQIYNTDEARVVNPHIYPDVPETWIYRDGMSPSKEVVINGKTLRVTTIGSNVFYALYGPLQFELPSHITTLEPYATYGLNYRFILNEGLTYIMDNNLNYVSDSNPIAIPSSLRYIGNNCFSGSDFSEITFADGVSLIGENSFSDLPNIEELLLPESLSYIGINSFCNLPKLKRVYIPGNLHAFPNILRNCPALERVEFSYKSQLEIANGPIIPSEVPEPFAFYNSNLENCVFVVPDGTKEIYRDFIIPGAKHIVEKSQENSAAEIITDSSTGCSNTNNSTYTLSGIAISEEAATSQKGIVIRKSNGHSEKVIVR